MRRTPLSWYKILSGERMVNIRLLGYCLQNKSDYSPACTAVLEQAYRETGDVYFLYEVTRRKMAAALYWYVAPGQF